MKLLWTLKRPAVDLTAIDLERCQAICTLSATHHSEAEYCPGNWTLQERPHTLLPLRHGPCMSAAHTSWAGLGAVLAAVSDG